MKKIYGIIYALLSSAAFGFMPIFAKIIYNNGSNTLTVISLRFLLAALMLYIYFLFAKVDFRVNKTQFTLLALIGLIGYTSTGMTLFYSYNYITVGLATTMHFVYPAIVIILNYFIYREAFTKNKVIALLVSITGVYILIGIKAEGIHIGGVILAIASGFCYAACVMGMNNKEIKKLSNLVTVFYFSLFAGVSLILFTFISGKFIFPINIETTTSIIGISLISTIVSIGLFVRALKIIGASSTSILGTFEPIVSIIMGIVLFKEKLTITLIIGTILILTSVIILSKEKQSTA
ncbi:DMT family transporter [Candidatus Clostridium radicumherbarum]|uniref:DMT family transporter n=1 Tax=Candidatus Clostridium radicumherbarum TaxID=3381662 RepID=A0ABW8TPE7_9CLOT